MGKVKQFIKSLIDKIPSWHQWQKIPSVLNKKERYFILGFLISAIISVFVWLIAYNLKNTVVAPNYGGSFTEGIAGNPQYLNPILNQANDADRDLGELIFSGLMKYNGKGELVPDLAENYEIKDEKTYDFHLKRNIKWHDGMPFTAEDVVFTITTIQNPDYRSPLRINWKDVEIEKLDEWTIRFKLKTPYAPFLANTTVGIAPAHIWKNIPPEKFLLAPENLNPIGTGPYRLKKMEKDKDGFITLIELEAFGDYNINRPFIEKININFYPSEEELIKAYNRGKVDNLALISNQNKDLLRGLNIKSQIYRLTLPRYFAVFLNQSKSKALADKNVRLALNYATNKKEIIERVLNGEGKQVDSPIPFGAFGKDENIKIYEFNLQKALEILDNAGWKDTNNDGIREKGKDNLELELITTDLSQLRQTADILKEQWTKIGASVNVIISNIGEIQQKYIRPREYQALIFGQVLGIDPDPYSFWHSSQKRDPGLNLALYDNSKADALLKDARQIINNDELRKQKYDQFQQLVIDDAAAIFLYSPDQLYIANKKIKGISAENIPLPSKRFIDIDKWYIKTQRVKK